MKLNYIELKKEVPIRGEKYDVVVVGGGTAGAVAAISAGREGLKTLVVEQFGCLGGSQTVGLVTPMMHNHIEGNPYSSAIDEEICDRMIYYGYGYKDAGGNKGWFDPQMLKLVLEEMVVEAGCEILYHTSMVDVIKEGQKIKAIVLHNKDGLFAVEAKVFIDCTGDADVVYYAALPCDMGNEEGINQAVSLRFQMTNVDCKRFGEYLESLGQKEATQYPYIHTAVVKGGSWPLNRIFEEKVEEGILTEQDLNYFQVFSVPGRPRDLAFNCPELGGTKNVIDGRYTSRKQIEGKKAILRLVRFLKEYIPGFENAYICDIAAMVGVRESRRAETEYVLMAEDVLNYRKFEDGIARTNYPVDIHGYSGKLECASQEVAEKYYEIPYRSLVVKGVDNLLVAGRCIGADFVAQSSLRVQQTCRAMGEAAGIAAKLAIQKNVPCRDVDGREVRDVMRRRGGKL